MGVLLVLHQKAAGAGGPEQLLGTQKMGEAWLALLLCSQSRTLPAKGSGFHLVWSGLAHFYAQVQDQFASVVQQQC